jgi:flagellar basal-body rod modification protein FlgD
MDASAVADINTTLAAQSATTRGFGELKSEDFLALMIQELQSQDPLDPQDTGQLLQQLSNIRQIEQTTSSNNTLDSLAKALQAFTGARFADPNSLIGSYVAGTVTGPTGVSTELQGVVLGVRFEGGGEAILELHNGTSLPVARVEQITLVENLPPEILQRLQEELGITPEEDATPPAEGETGTTDPTDPTDPADPTDPTEPLAALMKNLDLARLNARQRTQPKGSSGQRAQVVTELLNSLHVIGNGGRVGF